VVGGFAEIDLDRPEVQGSLEYLVRLLAPMYPGCALAAVHGAEIQVVAGYNIRLRLGYRCGAESGELEAVVYTDLQGKRRILGIQADGKDITELVQPASR
jgi:hypothetical protein